MQFPQSCLNLCRARMNWNQSAIGKLRIVEDVRKSTAVRERAGRSLDIDKVVSQEDEVRVICGCDRLGGRVAKDAQDVHGRGHRQLSHHEIKVNEEIEHEVFIDDMWPIVVADLFENARTQHRVERNDLRKMGEAGPRDILVPGFAASRAKSFRCDEPGLQSGLLPVRGTSTTACR